ncbi:DNA polymerase-3 subunit alpha [Dyadobacter jejuensis]|uniref:DNA-directed DNA polymerase n=1 Tax=Dyadobacter jejuensis TaxID=1082580 RepID=A0A316ALJ3_9BACT|nr:DNA polymerase III subunit alpha [Dyadobacter jejuensis]PWJ58268.1 DNA polymerase-3 subunit alpha [Dyadobacter jejuensis]
MLLNCHSFFSLRYGTIPEESLLELAQQNGYRCLALTDINNTSGCLNFVRMAPRYGIRPVLGIDFRSGIRSKYVALARNNQGFQELNRYLSEHLHHKKEILDQAPPFANAVVIYPFETLLDTEKNQFLDHEYIGISSQDLLKVRFSRLYQHQDRFVILQPVSFRHKKDFNTHRLLRAIDENTMLQKLTVFDVANENEQMLPIEELKARFKDYPNLIYNTEKLLESCEIHFAFGEGRQHQNLKVYGKSAQEDYEKLRSLSYNALGYRYGTGVDDRILDRIAMELDLIRQQDFVPFFLVNHDIVSYASHKDYYYVGRGSGANSIVAYLLNITNVDPIELDLYFERFMNLYRKNPPDFDIDFSWKDRDDITRYIFEKYGKNNQAALLATYNTFQHSAAVRELGKVFGLPTHEIDALSDKKFDPAKLDDLSKLVLRYARYLQDNNQPNHLSIHAGGVLITEKPIHYFSATDLPPKGYPTTQFDMVIAEDVGLYKYDILSQRGLAKIKDTLEVIRYNRPEAPAIDIHDVKKFKVDPNINALIRQASCIGCFYVESPAMRMLLKKLEVDTYLGLVAASSIIRPGVAKSGMMRAYILRHRFPERRLDAPPELLRLMEDTYGVMVYQEDVIKVAHYYAGLTLAEADVIRRGMSGKFRGRAEFEMVQTKFFENCQHKGYDPVQTQQIWDQIASFAGYAFAKGHSASYAVESYQSLFLKTYYPLEYMVATLNNGGGFYSQELYIHEARMRGAQIQAPCINHSEAETCIAGTTIYLGLQMLHQLELRTIQQLLQARQQEGPFSSLNDFLDRVPISIEQLTILIRIDAFRFTGIDKKTLLWKATFRLNKSPNKTPQKQLFQNQVKDYKLPQFQETFIDNAFDQIELLGFPLCSPFELSQEPIPPGVMSSQIHEFINLPVTQYGYLVTVKNTRTNKGETMQFGTFVDQNGDFIDTVHFPPIVKKFKLTGRGLYKIQGKVTEEFGFLSLEVSAVERLDMVSRV